MIRKSLFRIEKKSVPKLVLGYAAILSIVMGVVYAALTSMLRSYQQDLTQTVQLQYNRLTESLDSDLNQFAATAREMYTDADLKQDIFENHPYDGIQSTKKIQLYLNGLSLADDLFLSFTDDRVQTTTGYSSTDVYAYRTLDLTPKSAGLLVESVSAHLDGARLVLTNNDGEVGLMYLFTSPQSKQIAHMTVGVYVTAARISQQIDALFSTYSSISSFRLDTGEVLVRTDNLTVPDAHRDEIIDCMIDNKPLPDNRYTAVKCESESWAYTIYTAISTAQLWSRQQQIQKYVLVGGAGLFVLIAVVLVILNYQAFSPIFGMLHIAKKYLADEDVGIHGNEFDIIRAALEKGIRLSTEQQTELTRLTSELNVKRKHSDEQEKALHQLSAALETAATRIAETEATLAERARVARRNAVQIVLSGAETSDARLAELLDGLDAPYYTVLLTESADPDALCVVLAQTEAFALCAPTDSGGNPAVSIIIPLTDADRTGQRRTELGIALRRLTAQSEVCAGSVYASRREIAQAYREAATVHRASPSDHAPPIRLYESLGRHDRVGQFPPTLLPALEKAIRGAQISPVKRCVQTWMEAYALLSPTGENRRFQRYALIHTVQSALGDRLTDAASKRLFRLLGEEGDALGTQLSAILQQLLDPQPQPLRGKALQQQLIDYIQLHYLEFGLSIEQVADLFRVSRQTINALTKSAVKLTYSDYIAKLRFDRACALLKEPSAQIQSVAQQVGYVDARSFIRKFKSFYGITPGEYQQEFLSPQKDSADP